MVKKTTLERKGKYKMVKRRKNGKRLEGGEGNWKKEGATKNEENRKSGKFKEGVQGK